MFDMLFETVMRGAYLEGATPIPAPSKSSGLPPADGEMKVLNSTRPYILARNLVPGAILVLGGSPANYVKVLAVQKLKGGRVRVEVDLGGGPTQTSSFRGSQKLGYLPPQ